MFSSSVAGGTGLTEVQVSLDGMTWVTLAEVPADEDRIDVAVDLAAFAGQQIWLRFVFTPPPDSRAAWHVTDVRVVVRNP
jgi:hypothetical protein